MPHDFNSGNDQIFGISVTVAAYGQLYMAFSRRKRAISIKVSFVGDEQGITDSIVYKEIL